MSSRLVDEEGTLIIEDTLTTHEKLKEICDKIGYKIPQHIFYAKIKEEFWFKGDNSYVDEREIIFTQEFMDKFMDYYRKKGEHKMVVAQSLSETIYSGIMTHLDNPTDYLFGLLK